MRSSLGPVLAGIMMVKLVVKAVSTIITYMLNQKLFVGDIVSYVKNDRVDYMKIKLFLYGLILL